MHAQSINKNCLNIKMLIMQTNKLKLPACAMILLEMLVTKSYQQKLLETENHNRPFVNHKT